MDNTTVHDTSCRDDKELRLTLYESLFSSAIQKKSKNCNTSFSKTMPLFVLSICNNLVYPMWWIFDCIHSSLSVKMIDRISQFQNQIYKNKIKTIQRTGWSMYIKLQQDDIYMFVCLFVLSSVCFLFCLVLFCVTLYSLNLCNCCFIWLPLSVSVCLNRSLSTKAHSYLNSRSNVNKK